MSTPPSTPTDVDYVPDSSADGIDSTAVGQYTSKFIEEPIGSPAELEVVPAERVIRLDPLSLPSLYLKLRFRGQELGTATGFVVTYRGRHFLVSNWHVFSGRNADTFEPLCKKTAALPDEVRIAHHTTKGLGAWRFVGESMFKEDGSPRYVTYPAGPQVDVAALELQNLPAWVKLYPFDLSLDQVDIEPYPGMHVCIIGFPLGLRENVFLPIWKSGHLASDHDVPHKGLPAFLIDATTRNGMSGSPVVVRTSGAFYNRAGQVQIAAGLTRFLGVYAGRVHENAEVGRVWRPSAVREVLDYATSQ